MSKTKFIVSIASEITQTEQGDEIAYSFKTFDSLARALAHIVQNDPEGHGMIFERNAHMRIVGIYDSKGKQVYQPETI